MTSRISIFLIATLIVSFALPADAGGLRERLKARRQASSSQGDEDGGKPGAKVNPADLPAGTKIYKDIPYGKDPLQTFDVYTSANAQDAPIIMMVHGGGWKRGDKGGGGMVTAKVNYWQPKGFIYISMNYRLFPEVDIPTQAADVATAIALVQQKASTWGGDGSRLIMMGHSAGAHLVSYLSSDPALAEKYGAEPWSGTVSLDSAMLDAVEQMGNAQYKFLNQKIYVPVLGDDPEYWKLVSPYHHLSKDSIPLFIVCSNTRKDSCPQAYAYAKKAKSLGGQSAVHEEHMSHGQILANLGKPGSYTQSVDAFIQAAIRN